MRISRRTVAVAVIAGLATACASSGRGRAASTTQPSPSATTRPEPASAPAPASTAIATTGPNATQAQGSTSSPKATTSSPETVAERPLRAGAKRLHFEYGPIDVKPGQNNIDVAPGPIQQPDTDGFIVRVAPNLRFEDGTIPGVDIVHLHHGVWLNLSAPDATVPTLRERFYAAGEEKTTMLLPDGYGYQYHTSDKWLLNYMIHNLWPDPRKVWLTYDIDIVPSASPAAAAITPARPIWTDVQNGSVYPVFDVLKGSGASGQYTYPDDAGDAYAGGAPKNTWTADRDGVLIATAGHLHPGGLHTDLWLQRNGATALAGHDKPGTPSTAHIFQSVANYFEPAGAVSWDVSMTATLPTWRVAVRAGDVLSTSATYDSATASWYESMGIMVVWMADQPAAGESVAPDPFTTAVDTSGELTHGHLAENDNHGGGVDARYHDLTAAPSIAAQPAVAIQDFAYRQGDMLAGKDVPTVAPGATISYDNVDAPIGNGVWHTITACKAPCTAATGVAFPLANGDVVFDSGELGNVGPPTAGRTTWTTPADLQPGTYTYFCRIHPFMRGAFRVSASGATSVA